MNRSSLPVQDEVQTRLWVVYNFVLNTAGVPLDPKDTLGGYPSARSCWLDTKTLLLALTGQRVAETRVDKLIYGRALQMCLGGTCLSYQNEAVAFTALTLSSNRIMYTGTFLPLNHLPPRKTENSAGYPTWYTSCQFSDQGAIPDPHPRALYQPNCWSDTVSTCSTTSWLYTSPSGATYVSS